MYLNWWGTYMFRPLQCHFEKDFYIERDSSFFSELGIFGSSMKGLKGL